MKVAELLAPDIHAVPDFLFDPTLRLYLPLWKRDGNTFPSDDAYALTAAATAAPWTPLGRDFNGVNSYIAVGAASDLSAISNFSVLAWVKPDKLTSQIVVEKGATVNGEAWQFVIRADGSADFSVFGQAACTLWGIGAGATDRWYLWGGTIDRTGQGQTSYLNGQVVNAQTITALTSVTGTVLKLGQRPTNVAPYDGLMGDFLYFGRQLTLIEIQMIYEATRWRYQ